MSRGSLRINRADSTETTRRVDWLDDLASRIVATAQDPRTAVEAARERSNQSIQEMIQAIVGRTTSKPTSVDSVVKQMQERTGLNEYLQRVRVAEVKTAQTMAGPDVHAADTTAKEGELPASFVDVNEETKKDVQNYVTNLIDTHHGNIHVPAVVESVLQMFRQSGIGPEHVNDPNFEKYISDQIVSQKQKSPSQEEHNRNLGTGIGIDLNDADAGNSDMFSGLMPAKS